MALYWCIQNNLLIAQGMQIVFSFHCQNMKIDNKSELLCIQHRGWVINKIIIEYVDNIFKYNLVENSYKLKTQFF